MITKIINLMQKKWLTQIKKMNNKKLFIITSNCTGAVNWWLCYQLLLFEKCANIANIKRLIDPLYWNMVLLVFCYILISYWNMTHHIFWSNEIVYMWKFTQRMIFEISLFRLLKTKNNLINLLIEESMSALVKNPKNFKITKYQKKQYSIATWFRFRFRFCLME